jgi:tetratricopeptide (TPR) repeat protein
VRLGVARIVAAVALLCVASGQTDRVLAQGEDEQRKQAPTIDPNTGKRLNEAIDALTAEKYDAARAALDKIKVERLSPYERGRYEQIYAETDRGQGRYDSARGHLQAAIDSGGLNEIELDQIRFQIAQLYLAEERWQEGIAALNQWFGTTKKPNANAYYMLAIAYYQIEDYASALVPAEKAVEIAEKPNESWLQLLLALRIEREEYREAVPILHQMIQISPLKKEHWLQLSSVQAALEEYDKALVPLQVAYHAGLLSEDADLRRLVDLLLNQEIPHRAGLILTKALDEKKVEEDAALFEKLGNCWIAAREYDKAIAPLGRAAELSSEGDLYVRLAEVQVQREDWRGASEALRHALDKGGLKDLGDAQLLMGIAYFNLNEPVEARGWFQRAADHPKSKQQAESWIRHIEIRLQDASG